MTMPANDPSWPRRARWPGRARRSRGPAAQPELLMLLVLAAILGVPISAAYGFLALVSYLSRRRSSRTCHTGSVSPPNRYGGRCQSWPVGGVLADLAIRHLPGRGGASPAGGFAVHGAPTRLSFPASSSRRWGRRSSGAVLGPEMPLIAIGGGPAVLATRAARRRKVPAQGVRVLASARELHRPLPRCWDRPSQRIPAGGRSGLREPDAGAGAAAGPASGGNLARSSSSAWTT